MAVIRPVCVGRLFPSDAKVLRAQVEGLLLVASPPPCRPKAIIVPHAGYDYSGPIAGAGYACVAGHARSIRRVAVFGTCHVVRTANLLTTTADGFATPLGIVPVDTAAVKRAVGLPQVSVHDEAHAADHAVAVQLPLLQVALDRFEVVPFLVGDGDPVEVADTMDQLWDGDETLVVVSSDLSHHLDYEEACRRDGQTALAILRRDAEAIGPRDGCGHCAIAGLLIAARRHSLSVRQNDLRNSGDTAGGRERVVGYGAFVFEREG